MIRGLYCGSFDPFTLGHAAVVEKSLTEECDEIIICVGCNPDKRALFTPETRCMQIKAVFAKHPWQKRIKVISSPLMSVDIAAKYKCNTLIRGIRCGSNDLSQEHILACTNLRLAEIRGIRLETKFVTISDLFFSSISSSMVKQLCEYGEFILVAKYVPNVILQDLLFKYLKQQFLLEFPQNQSLWQQLVSACGQRAYHNLQHIAYMMNMWKIYEAQTADTPKEVPPSCTKALILAIYLHDYVCEPGKTDNEQLSANFVRTLPNNVPKDETAKLILATAPDAICNTPEKKLIADLDFSIFGTSDKKIWQQYCKDIRKEYQSVDTETYQKGRLAFLQSLLKRQRIFQTDWFYNRFEEQARKNIASEINRLL